MSSRGRSGGRAGAAGYGYQHTYLGLQLAKLLMGDHDPLVEVLWEKKALDLGDVRPEPVHVDDAILRFRSGRCVYVQVKETAPSGGWTARNLERSGVALQLWRQWLAKSPDDRATTCLRLASGGDIWPLRLVVDVALRSRTPAELISDEASEEICDDLRLIARTLSVRPDSQEFLDFLKSLQAEQLPSLQELQGLIVRSLTPFGEAARGLALKLTQIVAESVNLGPSARSAHTHESLLAALRDGGIHADAFVAAGVLRRGHTHDASFWDAYRRDVEKALRTFRVYGLEVSQAVIADLPSLFVPLRLAPVVDREDAAKQERTWAARPSWLSQSILSEGREDGSDSQEPPGACDLAEALRAKRRLALIGGPGCGKTTTLKWLSLVSALAGDDGRRTRQAFGLPPEPLRPLFVRFRRLADRVRARGLEGVGGRVGLVADFLAAEFEVGLAGTVLTKTEALRIAEDLLGSHDSIFLFDALDEIPDGDMRRRLFDAVADLMERYPAPRVVVSSRPYAFSGERAPLDLTLFEPLPLDRAARRAFARQWYRAVRSGASQPLTDDQIEVRAEDLARCSNQMPELSENPLLLSILALVHFNRQGLPVERSTLYDLATLAMLGHWEHDPAGRDLVTDPSEWTVRFNLHEGPRLRRVVEHLASEVQVHNEGAEFSEANALDGIARGLEGLPGMPQAQIRERSASLLRLLVERSGLVQERSPGTFAFVHLSFQDYLVARWYVSGEDDRLWGLATLAADERYGETIRFAAALCGASGEEDGLERGRRLIRDVGSRNAILGAACLLEAPRVELPESVLEALAREVWTESTYMWRRHHHPWVASRLTWVLLSRSPRADDLLLEFLSLEPGDRHRMEMGPEALVLLLAGRPAGPVTSRLQWVLRRLEVASHRYDWLRFSEIASLLLVEAGAEHPSDRLPALVRLLGEESRFRGAAGTLSERAEGLLRTLAEQAEAKISVCHALEEACKTEDPRSEERGDRVAYAAAKLLLALAPSEDSDPLGVLVQRGFRNRYRHDDVALDLLTLLRDPKHHDSAVAALTKGLERGEESVRRGSARVLRESGLPLPPLALLLLDEADAQHGASELRQRLEDPRFGTATLAALAEGLWETDGHVAWRAATVLVEAGRGAVPGVAQALVKVGLASDEWRPTAVALLAALRSQPALELLVRAALFDGLGSQEDAVAAASALILAQTGEAQGDMRVRRIAKASLRHRPQSAAAAECLRTLMSGESANATTRAVGEVLAAKDLHPAVAWTCATLIMETGRLATPNLARGLVLGGLAIESNHKRAASGLKLLLDDPRLVSDARAALAEGIASKDGAVAWGSVRCLWESGGRTDPALPEAIVRAGLDVPPRRDTARLWLLELLGNPRTATRATAALDEAASEALRPSGGRLADGDLAFEIGTCLLAAKAFEAKSLVDALVRGGLSQRDRQTETARLLTPLLATEGALFAEVEEELWSAAASAQEVLAWGAAKTLMMADMSSVQRAIRSEGKDADERAEALLKALLRAAPSEPSALEALHGLVSNPQLRPGTNKALNELLQNDEGEVAYGAASCLFQLGEAHRRGVPRALILHGLSHYDRKTQAATMLDDLRSRPLIAPAVTEALQRAMWGDDATAAWSAATYLMDRGATAEAGVARGLVFGGLAGHRHGLGEGWEARVLALLSDANCRPGVLNALRAALLNEGSDEEGRLSLSVLSLLLMADEEFHEYLLQRLEREAASGRWPLALLAAAALSGRAKELLVEAERHRLGGLARLLGGSLDAPAA